MSIESITNNAILSFAYKMNIFKIYLQFKNDINTTATY